LQNTVTEKLGRNKTVVIQPAVILFYVALYASQANLWQKNATTLVSNIPFTYAKRAHKDGQLQI